MDRNAEDNEMNLIPFVLTTLAIAFGSIFFEFETGLLIGLFVGLVAVQGETHLKLIGLQDKIRTRSRTSARTTPKAAIMDSKADTQVPNRFESRLNYSRAPSIPARAERALQFRQPEPFDEPVSSINEKPAPSVNFQHL
jgi:hypothetical protein